MEIITPTPGISVRNCLTHRGIPSEYFQDSYNALCCPLTPEYGLMNTVDGNHLIAADVLNGIGAFDSTTGWTTIGAGWTIAGGVADFNAAGSTNLISSSRLISGVTYEITFTVLNYVSGYVRCSAHTTLGTLRSANGTYTERLVSNGTSIIIGAFASTDLQIDNVTYREVYDGNISSEGAYFNGVSNCLQSTRTVDLSGTNKVSVYANIKVNDYNLSGFEILYEFSPIAPSNQGSFFLATEGATAGDPMRWSIYGNVGDNGARYLLSKTNLADGNFHSLVCRGDFSVAASATLREGTIIKNGQFLPFDSATSSNNNTGNFGNHNLYIGGRAGISLFSNIYMNRLLIRSTVDSPETIADYYAWQNDIRNPHFFSLYGEE